MNKDIIIIIIIIIIIAIVITCIMKEKSQIAIFCSCLL